MTALRYAARHGYDQVVRTLLEHGAAVKSTLKDAVDYGHEAVVRVLLGAGAAVDAESTALQSSGGAFV